MEKEAVFFPNTRCKFNNHSVLFMFLSDHFTQDLKFCLWCGRENYFLLQSAGSFKWNAHFKPVMTGSVQRYADRTEERGDRACQTDTFLVVPQHLVKRRERQTARGHSAQTVFSDLWFHVTLTLYDVSESLSVQQVFEASHLLFQLADQAVVGILVDHSVTADLFRPIRVPEGTEAIDFTSPINCQAQLQVIVCRKVSWYMQKTSGDISFSFNRYIKIHRKQLKSFKILLRIKFNLWRETVYYHASYLMISKIRF